MARLEDVLTPDYLDGLEAWSLDGVRARRDEATEVETALSYVRRMVQGRLDIVLAEQESRRVGESAGDVAELVARLPTILGDHVLAPGFGRLPTLIAPGDIDPPLVSALEDALPAARMSTLAELDDADLEVASHKLERLERSISSQRRAVFEVLDRLQNEIVRRYRSGEASVDSLLP